MTSAKWPSVDIWTAARKVRFLGKSGRRVLVSTPPQTMIPASGIRFCGIMRKQDQILSMFACSITLRHFAISALM